MSQVTTTGAPSATSTKTPEKKKAPGLSFRRHFTKAGVSPYDEIEWEFRTASITDAKGGSAKVIKADLTESNGVIHVTDAVSIPG